ncbi:uncharacterized protein SCHCODRAFT_02673207 [Schizophyllum commune H4-8]|nr:uncharacterized protein SCHCODRAFT_02673207 [Schizophyllum commune H4-8]KAI5886193.1 hypothetical protein SCHCODRAFT_02673207 [Schizophyllum commune H4-8]
MTSRNREPRSRAASLVRAARSATSSRSRSRASTPGSLDLTDSTSAAGSTSGDRKRKHRSASLPRQSKRSRRIAAIQAAPDELEAGPSSAGKTQAEAGLSGEGPEEVGFDLTVADVPEQYADVETLPDIGLGVVDRAPSPSTNAKGKQRAATRTPTPETKAEPAEPAPPPKQTPLAEYTCPICFFAPTNATLTPCGHICCGSCLFTAVKTAMLRAAHTPEGLEAKCPVCRATIPGWDGRGGGVIGLKLRSKVTISL